jgi:hypothetical protein
MIKRLFAVLLLMTSIANAGIISRTYTYTDGNTISANENNTNETTLYNEINGNISSANILDGTIVNGDIADTTIARSKFAATVPPQLTDASLSPKPPLIRVPRIQDLGRAMWNLLIRGTAYMLGKSVTIQLIS